MRILSFGAFIDYQIQLSNALCKTESVMLIIPAKELPNAFLGTIDKRVEFHLFGRETRLYNPKVILVIINFIKLINKFDPDIIHVQFGGGILLLVLLQFFKKFPLVGTFHDVKIHEGECSFLKIFIRHYERNYSDKIIVHGEKLKEQMLEEYGNLINKVHAIPIGEHEVAPFSRYSRSGLGDEGNLILFFGRIWKYKGLEYLIKAEPIITKEVPGAKIIIAGAGEDFQKYRKLMINKNNFIVYNYRIPYKEGAELFQRSSVVVLPYIEGSQSGVIPTAYGFKKPVVVTNVGSIPEIVDNGITGFIVPPRDINALAQAIIRLLKDKELRQQMGENAYKKLKTDLSWDKIAEKTIKIYKDAIRDRNASK